MAPLRHRHRLSPSTKAARCKADVPIADRLRWVDHKNRSAARPATWAEAPSIAWYVACESHHKTRELCNSFLLQPFLSVRLTIQYWRVPIVELGWVPCCGRYSINCYPFGSSADPISKIPGASDLRGFVKQLKLHMTYLNWLSTKFFMNPCLFVWRFGWCNLLLWNLWILVEQICT